LDSEPSELIEEAPMKKLNNEKPMVRQSFLILLTLISFFASVAAILLVYDLNEKNSNLSAIFTAAHEKVITENNSEIQSLKQKIIALQNDIENAPPPAISHLSFSFPLCTYLIESPND